MIILETIKYDNKNVDEKTFPFNVPVIKSLKKIKFESPVTIITGENGTGKSTILESLAAAIGSITIGGENIERDETLRHAQELSRHLKLSWKKKTKRGFFMRAEDFFNFVKITNKTRQQMIKELERVDSEYKNHSRFTQGYARAAFESSLHDIEGRYGENFDANSHGESFLKLFQSRIVPKGLYILDEPEAPLSPVKQYGLMMIIKQAVEDDSQFIISTHSPILMAYPGATILTCDEGKLEKCAYKDLEHVKFMQDFLNNPEVFLRRL